MVFLVAMDVPVLAFFLVLFFGQQITCGLWGPGLWLDKTLNPNPLSHFSTGCSEAFEANVFPLLCFASIRVTGVLP